MLKIFFATDIHGSEKCFRKFLNAGKVYGVDILILGGDITGKMIVPLVEQRDGSYKCKFVGTEHILTAKDQIETMAKTIRSSGYYPYFTNPEKVEELSTDSQKLDSLFLDLMLSTLEQWMDLAEERLRNTSIKCYITGGNDDPFEITRVLQKPRRGVIDPENIVVQLDREHEMISSGFSNITPWKCPRDLAEEELIEKIDTLASGVRNMEGCIFNFHCPPFNTGLDIVPKLDDQLKPVVSSGRVVEIPVGSTAVRGAIEKYQPLLGLHGHIHECRNNIRLGRTLCLNPGSEYSEGILRGVLVNLEKNKVKGFLSTSG